MNVVEKEFNALAAEYEENRLSAWYQAHAEEMLQHCTALQHGDILDVGCGTGYFLREYVKRNPGVRAVGIDTSAEMISTAREKAAAEGLENIGFIHADWEKLDPRIFEGYRFRLIFCANAFHYFEQAQTASNKLFNQLSEGGRLYVLERNKSRSLLTLLWGFLHTVFIRDQVVFYKTSDPIHLFNNAGFVHVKALRSIKKYFWKNKTFTSIVLIQASRPETRNGSAET